jgi:hypothetical protein
MYKNASEVAARLAEPYDGTIEQREGGGGRMFSYVPWTETYRRLNDIFGPLCWNTTAPHSYYANGTYNVEFGLSATVRDEDGTLITKTVPAQGQAVARGENDDNALKSAQSDALSRGAKLFGNAFGFHLYEQKAPKQNHTTTSRPTGTGFQPSTKQLGVLHKLGYTDDQIAEMPSQVWKQKIDEFFATRQAGGDLPF